MTTEIFGIDFDAIIKILDNPPLAFKSAIAIGFVILILLVLSIILPRLRTPSTKQSMFIAVVGILLILSGLIALTHMPQRPLVENVTIIPKSPLTISKDEKIEVKTSVVANDPNPKNDPIQNLFFKRTPLLYTFTILVRNNSVKILQQGPMSTPQCSWLASSLDAGAATILIVVSNGPTAEQNVTNAYTAYIKEA
jgi:hypothetical protein